MSDQQLHPGLAPCGGRHDPVLKNTLVAYSARTIHTTARIGACDTGPEGLPVNRYLPNPHRRMIGPWCFVEHFGPAALADTPLHVGPHPHLGMQAITWLFEGQIEHRDSLGNHQVIGPGEIAVLTAGSGLSHSEEALPGSARLHGLQLWAALPSAQRDIAPAFHHFEKAASLILPGVRASVLLGSYGGVSSPAPTHSTSFAAVVRVESASGRDSVTWLPLLTRREYGLLPLSGDLLLDGDALAPGQLYYLGTGRTGGELQSEAGCTFLLLGGEPFEEEVQVWWNLVAGSCDEIVSSRALWNAHSPRFGKVRGASSPRVTAPVMSKMALRPRTE